MRGEFIRADGLVLPNNISIEGAKMILAAAFRNDVPAFHVGLVTGLPSPTMTCASMTEPTIGVNGYARVPVARSPSGWPTQGESGGEAYIESDWLVFAAAGGDFSSAIQRMMLLGFSTFSAAHPVYALSAALPSPYVITPTTPLGERQFKYRVYI